MVTVEDAADVAAFQTYSVTTPIVVVETPKKVVTELPPPITTTIPSTATSTPVITTTTSPTTNDRIFASPLAKKLALEANISLSDVYTALGGAYGSQGRLVSIDVVKALSLPRPSAAAQQQQASQVVASANLSAQQPVKLSTTTTTKAAASTIINTGVYNDFVLSETSQYIAKTLTLSKQLVPHYYLSIDLDLTELLLFREELNAKYATKSSNKKGEKEEEKDGGLSVIDFFVKAAALSMKQVLL
jgi:pyruvate dehydrogenase E2 component (dihydrolipoamide acetyltransferase)